MSYFLGIDVGTGGTRALVLDDSGTVLGSATAEHVPFASPQTGWAEQDPDDWWRACRQAVPRSLEAARIATAYSAASGLSGQLHGARLLVGDGRVVRPALMWIPHIGSTSAARPRRWASRSTSSRRPRRHAPSGC